MEDPTVIRVAKAMWVAGWNFPDGEVGIPDVTPPAPYIRMAKAAIKALAQTDPVLHVEGELDSNTISRNSR